MHRVCFAVCLSLLTSCAVTQPTSGMLRPKRTRENDCALDWSIAASAFRAEISP